MKSRPLPDKDCRLSRREADSAGIAAPGEWFVERTSSATAHLFRLKGVACDRVTAVQRVRIVDTESYGRMLILDDKLQSAAFDEHIYHEALVHPALLRHAAPRRVFVAGGGEGATLREIFRHPAVERVVMADIDGEVVDLCRRHLAAWHQGAFGDPRLELVIGDARACLERQAELFDVLIIDISDPDEGSPARRLYTRQFHELAARRLAAGGLIALQAGDTSPACLETHCAIFRTVARVFPFARSYHAFIPSFNTAWGFVLAGRDFDPAAWRARQIDRRIGRRGLALRFYDEETHRHMFSLPKEFRRRRDAATDVMLDD
jgi:spermidine synthase